MAHENPKSPEPLRALQYRASVAMAEIAEVIERGERRMPDATASAVAAWAAEITSASMAFWSASCDVDEGL